MCVQGAMLVCLRVRVGGAGLGVQGPGRLWTVLSRKAVVAPCGLETAQPWVLVSPGGVIPFSAGTRPLRFRAVSALQSETAGRPAAEVPVLPAEDALDSLQQGFCPPAQGPSLGRPVLLAFLSPQHPCWRPPLGGGLRVLLSRPSPDCQHPLPGGPGGPSPAQRFPLSHPQS